MSKNSDHEDRLSPELEALEARLDAMGAAERSSGPASLEARIVLASAGVLSGSVSDSRKRGSAGGVLAGLSIRRLDWPMRVAAVIAVGIGGWAAWNGLGGPDRVARPSGATYDAGKLADLLSSWPNGGATDQIRDLISTAVSIEDRVWSEDVFGVSDPENL